MLEFKVIFFFLFLFQINSIFNTNKFLNRDTHFHLMRNIIDTNQIILVSSKNQIKTLFLICKTNNGNVEEFKPNLRKSKSNNDITFKIDFLKYSECQINYIKKVDKYEKKFKCILNYKEIILQSKKIIHLIMKIIMMIFFYVKIIFVLS